MTGRTWRVAGLLFFSGGCALVYQTVWLRQFRLVFGASTWATAAVLAIFMAGLGIGSALLGRRADGKERPLAFYARLELLIAGSAAISPLLLELVARIYFSSGGSPALGTVGATLLRLLLALLILGPATFLMGGTLPAASRAVETEKDASRRGVALLYGVNTLGAVAGTLLSTFVLLERFGNRATLFCAVVVNVAVALIARTMARPVREEAAPPPESEPQAAASGPAVAPAIVYAAAAIAGFSFLLMELVWYRMLSPILGGTNYMFGLVLAIALAGIGLGGATWAIRRDQRATLGAFALTSTLEALAIAVPFAIGDRIALFANVLRGLGTFGFDGHIVAWTLVTTLVIFPAAFVSGIQFPLLIALLGRGRENVGRHIGAAYAWNTVGAIAGSLAGGFGLLPLLSAPTTWRLVVVLLAAVGVVAAFLGLAPRHRAASYEGRWRGAPAATLSIALALFAIAAIASTGPTAVWRHSGIGAARAPRPATKNDLQRWILETRRNLLWDRDGRESSVGVLLANDLAFIVNGKSDGAARGDADTQVMLGMVPAALHRNPKSALVIGLGTGESAGWLAAIPSMERVDAVELEPVVLDVARACGPLNAGAMNNPKLHVSIGDAREVLLTSGRKWDVIASEPSNPYRAGIASLLTLEFYEAARDRLAPGGLLAQWVQSYSVHADTMRTIYATLSSVFPHVQTWWTTAGDMVMVASVEPIAIDADALRARLAAEPYRSAVFNTWRTRTAEGFLARMFANEEFTRRAASAAAELNTDDRTVIEFGFARSLDENVSSIHRSIAQQVEKEGLGRPQSLRGEVDWDLVARNRPWSSNPQRPVNLGQLAVAALRAARQGDEEAEGHAATVAAGQPIEADVILAQLRTSQKRYDEAAAVLSRALVAFRTDPWPQPDIMVRALELAIELSRTSPERARSMNDALSRPFAVWQQEPARRLALIVTAPLFEGCGERTLSALRALEPNPVWIRELLTIRANCYGIARDPLAAAAWEDLARFEAAEPSPILMPRKRSGD